MGTSTLDHTRPEPATTGTPGRRRRLPLLAAAALTLAAVSTGVAVALAGRAAPAGQPSNDVVQVAAPPSSAPQPRDQGGGTPGSTPTSAPGPTATTPPKPVLADGSYDGFVRSVNVGGRTIVVDLVQVLEGEAAYKAAKEDGKHAEQVGPGVYLPEQYVRNQNSLLRTLPVARDVRIQFYGVCEGPAPGPPALSELAKRMDRFKGWFYYHFTVEDGLVQTMQERQVQPAC
jgi:hypothetical protein